MADDEQFSLCWNNFNSNLSAGFHESLCRGDLVDVTLAAEGQFVKAHRLVLSVCSPYFRRMFTQMPANQHAFVFLKDVSHTALKDLIQFMYCGEVNVKQDALPAFISTAEALQIKGLTDSEPAPSQSPAKPSTPAPQPQPQTITTPTMTTATTTTSPRARTSNQRSRYKLESEDSGDENKPTNQLVLQQTQTTQQHQQATLVQQTQKRPAQRSITPHTAPTVKRIKNNDPLEGTDATTTTTQITVQAVTDSKSATGEPEYIDLPIDLPTKSEPDYGEEAADVEAAEQEATYVEDDSYGDMKYDESYFTENEEGGGTTTGATTSTAAVKQSVSFSDSYVSDTGEQQQAATEAQVIKYSRNNRILSSSSSNPYDSQKPFVPIDYPLGVWIKDALLWYMENQKRGINLIFNGYMFKREATFRSSINWICSKGNGKRASDDKCLARCVTRFDGSIKLGKHPHNHGPQM